MDLSTHRSGSAPTVLVVDDSPAQRYATVRVIQAAGFRTLEAGGGAEALQLAKERVDAVVLDVRLPDVHGFEVCRLLRRQPGTAALPVIHVSAVQLSPQDMVAGLAAGADAYLLRPVEPAVLVANLQALIRARSTEERLRRSEQRFRGAFEKASCGMAMLDEKGRLVETNPQLLAILGFTREELVGRKVSGLTPRDWKSEVDAVALGWGRSPWRGQFPLIDRAGNRINISWSVSPHLEPGLSVAVAVPAPDPLAATPPARTRRPS